MVSKRFMGTELLTNTPLIVDLKACKYIGCNNLFRTGDWWSESFGVYSSAIRRRWEHHGKGKGRVHSFI